MCFWMYISFLHFVCFVVVKGDHFENPSEPIEVFQQTELLFLTYCFNRDRLLEQNITQQNRIQQKRNRIYQIELKHAWISCMIDTLWEDLSNQTNISCSASNKIYHINNHRTSTMFHIRKGKRKINRTFHLFYIQMCIFLSRWMCWVERSFSPILVRFGCLLCGFSQFCSYEWKLQSACNRCTGWLWVIGITRVSWMDADKNLFWMVETKLICLAGFSCVALLLKECNYYALSLFWVIRMLRGFFHSFNRYV